MCSSFIIAYATHYGSTQRYAAELGRRLDSTPLLIDDAPEVTAALNAHPAATLIVFSPVHGPSNAGVSFLNSIDLGLRRVALCTVGMTLDAVAQAKDGAARGLGKKAAMVQRFYLPGSLDYSQLTAAHRNTMWTLVNMIKVKPLKSENDRMMIDTFNTDVDRVDLTRLNAVVEWARA